MDRLRKTNPTPEEQKEQKKKGFRSLLGELPQIQETFEAIDEEIKKRDDRKRRREESDGCGCGW